MRVYWKLLVVAVCIAMSATLSAQGTELRADFSHTHLRKPQNGYLTQPNHRAMRVGQGRVYNVVSTGIAPVERVAPKTLGDNSGSAYYRSYGVSNTSSSVVNYNAPREIKYNASERTPFEDVVVVSGPMRVGRDEKPYDPAPIDGVILPFVLIAGVYVTMKMKKI